MCTPKTDQRSKVNEAFEFPLVTVICFTYNHEKFISQAIESFLDQITSFSMQIVIHDDASEDNTTEIIEGYRAKYPSLIRTVIQRKNQFHTLKNGIWDCVWPLVNSEYVAICDGDDYWQFKHKLEIQVNILRRYDNISMVFHNTTRLGDQAKDLRWPTLYYGRVNFDAISRLEFMTPPTSSIVMRKSVYQKRYISGGTYGDRLLALSAATMGDIYGIPDRWSCYRQTGLGIFSSLDEKEKYLNDAMSRIYIIKNFRIPAESFNFNRKIICNDFIQFSRAISQNRNFLRNCRDFCRLCYVVVQYFYLVALSYFRSGLKGSGQ